MKNESNRPSILGPSWGIFLIIVGGIWLASNVLEFAIDFTLLWPVFLLIPGLIFWAKYLLSKGQSNYQMLIPANILVFMSVTFFFNMFATNVLDYDRAWLLTVSMYSTGPVAIAFWITWSASAKKGRYLVPAVILTIISIAIAFITVPLALFNTPFFQEVSSFGFPLLLILIGLLIIFGPIWAKAFEKSEDSENHKPKEKMPEVIIEEPKVKVEEAEIVKDSNPDTSSAIENMVDPLKPASSKPQESTPDKLQDAQRMDGEA